MLLCPQVAPSTLRKTGTSTRTPGADGSKHRELKGPDQALRKAIPLPQEVGESKEEAVEDLRLPLVEMGGNRGRKVLAVLRAVEAEEAGAATGDGKWTAQRRKGIFGWSLGGRYVQARQSCSVDRDTTSGHQHSACRLQQIEQAYDECVCYS